MKQDSWKDKLRKRWGLKNTMEVFVILLVFACTGITVMLLKKPLLAYWSLDAREDKVFSVIYYILIFPVYNIILLFYGSLFGKFSFFWDFEKKTFRRISRLFNKSKH